MSQGVNTYAKALEVIEKLLPYCQHKDECEKFCLCGQEHPCTCGLDEIRKELE